jgi:elongation of very long chain fatty acids protein 6
MNYGVHAIMYFYYFLMAVKLKPKWFNSIYITVSQISQMVVGVAVTSLGFILPPKYEKECSLKSENNMGALIMYGSYLLLFVQFFIQRYQVKGGKPKSKSLKKE